MAQSDQLIEVTVTYIRLEAVALIFSTTVKYLVLVLVTLKKNKYLILTLVIQMLLSVVLDSFFISDLSYSLKLGVNGIAITNVIANIKLLVVLIILGRKEDLHLIRIKGQFDWAWIKEWTRIGGISGLESLVRNAAFLLMILRLVNFVEQ